MKKEILYLLIKITFTAVTETAWG